jgi:hypothetical protein
VTAPTGWYRALALRSSASASRRPSSRSAGCAARYHFPTNVAIKIALRAWPELMAQQFVLRLRPCA